MKAPPTPPRDALCTRCPRPLHPRAPGGHTCPSILQTPPKQGLIQCPEDWRRGLFDMGRGVSQDRILRCRAAQRGGGVCACQDNRWWWNGCNSWPVWGPHVGGRPWKGPEGRGHSHERESRARVPTRGEGRAGPCSPSPGCPGPDAFQHPAGSDSPQGSPCGGGHGPRPEPEVTRLPADGPHRPRPRLPPHQPCAQDAGSGRALKPATRPWRRGERRLPR